MKTRARLGAHCMLVMLSWMVPSLCEATLSKVSPLAVKILYDNSGSMYPGYRPDGAGKSTLGVGFFREYPQFRQWLTDFVTLQSVLNGQTVSLTAVTSVAGFDAAGDFIQLQDEVPLAGFNTNAFDKLGPDQWGRQTFLAQALEAFTGDFEGLVWLLTDNYVDTGGGDELDRQVVAFFEMLRQDPRYHAVHLFRLPFVDTEHDQRSALAIYGLLISPSPLELDSAAFFDRKFRDTFRLAERPGRRGPLFPEQEHLKLKDLDIEPMILRIDSRLEPRFGELEKSWFREKRTIELGLPGEIKSHLTQHSVIAGHYDLELVGAFVPDDSAKKEFGVEQIPSSMFGSVSGTLSAEIPPNGTYPLTARLASNQAIELSFRQFWDQLKAALTGLEVEYAGNVRMTFSDVCVRFERSQMRGIFGADLTSEVFDFSDKCRITPQPALSEVRFKLSVSPRRWLIFLLVLPLLALCAGFTRLATEKITYRIVIDGEQEMVSLRRLGSHALRYRHYRLGHLRRGLDGHHRFTANAEDVAVKIEVEAQAGHYVARIRDLGAILFSAEPLRGSSPGGAAESSSPRRPGESMIARPGQASSASKIPTVQTHQPSQGTGGAPPPRRPGPADRNFERQ